MKVFVTGGNGFIGSSVVRALHEQGHTVRCLLRESSRTDCIDGVPFEPYIGDVRDAASLGAGLLGCDAVIHLASISSWDKIRSPLMRQVVVDGTENLLRAAVEAGGPRFVYVSSCMTLGATSEPQVLDEQAEFNLPPEPFVYAHAKVDAEALCRRYHREQGLPTIIVLPCETWGPNDDDFITAEYARDTLKDWPAMTVRGGTALGHVDDVARGVVAAALKGRPGERYILGGENLSTEEITRLVLEAGGKPGKWVLKLPNGLTLWALRALETLHLPTPVNPDLVAHAIKWWFVDSGKAERELGYTYRPAKETIGEVVTWLQEAGHV